MAEQLEIVFTERGGAGVIPQSQPSAPDEHSQPQSRAPGPADRVTGPKKPDSTTGRDIENAVIKAANVLGVGGLTGTAIQLRRAFSDLFESVTASAKAVDAKRRVDAGVGSGPSAEIKTPSAPKPEPPVTGPPIPKTSITDRFKYDPVSQKMVPLTNKERDDRANASLPSLRNQGYRYDPISQKVVGGGNVEAPPVIARPPSAFGPLNTGPVTGPTAGAGTAASGLSRLAAMAGPAALAVAGITAAIGAGVIIIKKTFAAIDAEASRLSGYSGALAGAEARAQVRQQFADIRRAQTIGPQLARARDFTSSMETKLTDLKTSIIKFGLDTADAIHTLPKTFADGLQGAADDLKVAAKELSGDKEGAKKMAEELERIRQLQEKQARDKADEKDLANYGDDIMDAFLGNFTEGMSSRDRRKAARKAARRA